MLERNKDMEDWKVRFKKEYYELKERFQKLDMMIGKYEKGQLEFEPKCPIDLLKRQRSVMWDYLSTLEQRAKIEEIKTIKPKPYGIPYGFLFCPKTKKLRGDTSRQ